MLCGVLMASMTNLAGCRCGSGRAAVRRCDSRVCVCAVQRHEPRFICWRPGTGTQSARERYVYTAIEPALLLKCVVNTDRRLRDRWEIVSP